MSELKSSCDAQVVNVSNSLAKKHADSAKNSAEKSEKILQKITDIKNNIEQNIVEDIILNKRIFVPTNVSQLENDANYLTNIHAESTYINKTELENHLNQKQEKLTAGNNIVISQDNVISATNTVSTEWNNILGKPNTIQGYGIDDVKILGDTITIGENSITPLTHQSNLDATKLSGDASINITGNADTATKAIKDGDGNVITSTYSTISNLNSLLSLKQNILNSNNAGNGIEIADGTISVSLAESVGNTGVRAVIESYEDGTSWYRVWSDGWIEQGGQITSNANSTFVNITFLKNFRDTNYSFLVTPHFDSSSSVVMTTLMKNKLTTGVSIAVPGRSSNNTANWAAAQCDWVAQGHIGSN